MWIASIALLLLQAAPAASPDAGSLALAVTQPAAQAAPAISAALGAPDAKVRAVAARAAAVSGLSELSQPILDVLGGEADPLAASEQIRALLLLRGADALPVVEPIAAKAGVIKVVNDWRARHPATGDSALPEAGSARTIELWVPGLVEGMAAAAGCDPGRLAFGFARVHYRPDGRPSKVELDAGQLPRACHRVLDALARLSLAEADRAMRVRTSQWIVAAMGSDYFPCLAGTEPPPLPMRGGPGRITPPQKTYNVPPVYPPRMQKDRVQGMAMFEGWISTSGCVRSLRVTKSAHPADDDQPLLDVEGIRAAVQWRFTPALVDGAPMPVLMVLTVSYSLR